MKKRVRLGLILSLFLSLFLRTDIGPQNTANSIPGQSTTLLPDGQWLLLGGELSDGRPLSAAQIWNPRTGAVTPLATELQLARAYHSATMLPDGTILIFGGIGTDGQVLAAPELFDPSTSSFILPPSSFNLLPRSRHSATVLTEGQLLIAGGAGSKGEVLDTAELWDPRRPSSSSSPALLNTARRGHSATLLSDGTVLFQGGEDGNGNPVADAELFNPATQSFELLPGACCLPPSGSPELMASLPVDGDVDVAVDSVLSLRFSNPLNVATVNSDTVTLSGPSGVERIKVVPAEGGMLTFLTPEAPLLASSTYTVSVNGVFDVSGSLLPVSGFTFSTQPSAVSDQPTTTSDQSATGGQQSAASSESQSPESQNHNLQESDLGWRGEWGTDPKTGRRTPHSPWQDLSPLQAEPGVTALSGQVLRMDGEPLRHVTIRVGDKKEKTDHNGQFLLKHLTAGHHEMIIDGRSASTLETAYGIFVPGIDLLEGITSVLPFTIWMPEIDMENAVTIPSPTTTEVVVTSPKIPGLEVRIPPGTVIRDIDGKAVTKVGVTLLPLDRGPMPKPADIDIPFMFTTQPGGSKVEGNGIRIVFPNPTGLPVGARVKFWKPEPDPGWFVYGQGTVSSDGSQIIPDPGVAIYRLSCASMGNPNSAAPDGPECKAGQNCKGGDPVDLGTGLFVLEKTDLFLPDIIPIKLTRTYRQNDTLSRPFGIGTTHPYEIFLVGDKVAYTYAELILADGGRIRYNRISAGTSNTDAVMEHTSTQTMFYKSVLSWNSARAGWDIKFKDGTVYEFIVYSGPEIVLLQAIRDRNGNRLSITRDANRKMTQITSPNGRWLQFTYDASNRITQAKDNSGRAVNYTYDTSGRLWKVTDPNNGVTEHTYDDTVPTDVVRKTRMLTIKDARGIVFLTNEYDTTGKVIKQTQPDTSTFLFNYTVDINGNTIQTDVTDPRGNIRRVKFNADGQITEDTRAVGTADEQKTTYELQAGTNLLLSATDALNRKTAYTYDTMGNVLTTTRLSGTPQAVTTTATYEPTFNQLASVTDPLNHTWTAVYDAKGNLISVTNPLNQTFTATYNAAGQPISITDPLNNATQFTYDFGDLVAVSDPLGNATTRFIDAAGRLLSITNPLNHLTLYDYDPLNRLTKVTDPLNGPTNFGYDPNGNLLNVTDAKNQATSYTYDNMDRLGTRRDPLLKTETYGYDLAGNLTQFTDRKTQGTTFTYDALNRRIQARYADLSTTTYTYDKGNRLLQVNDSISGLITRTYDGLNRLISESTPQGSVSYTYDAAGRRTSMTVPGQTAINYAYDNANRLTQITQGSSIVSFAYDAAGRRTSLTLPNGVLVEYTYDTASRVTEIKYKKGVTVLGNLTYSYDKAGSRTKTGGTFARTGIPSAITSATYNAANQQTALGNQTMTFDNNGNLTGITDASGTTIYTWNSRNQLTGISSPGVTASFVYDGLGRREKKTINSSLTEFLYDGLNPVQETSGATVLANILTGLGIDEFFTRTDVPAAATSYFLPDAPGSALALADTAGAVQTEYTYEPFGKTTATGSSNTNPFQFTGRENDATGLYYYRARYYHPQLQRFISEDPIEFFGGDFNLYGYVGNSPIDTVDPWGLMAHGTMGGSFPPGGGCRKDPCPPKPKPKPKPEPKNDEELIKQFTQKCGPFWCANEDPNRGCNAAGTYCKGGQPVEKPPPPTSPLEALGQNITKILQDVLKKVLGGKD